MSPSARTSKTTKKNTGKTIQTSITSEKAGPTLEEWRSLYDAMESFYQQGPWKWLSDIDLFCVEDPVTGEMGFCSVMGNAGQHYGLAVYLGEEGLQGYFDMMDYEGPDPSQTMLFQKCLMASFEDRELIEERDRDVVKSLGLKFKGKDRWPKFREYAPYYFPWYLNGEQVRSLTSTLAQVVIVADRIKKDRTLLRPVKGKAHLMFARKVRNIDGVAEWSDGTYSPIERSLPIIIPTEENIANMREDLKDVPRSHAIWEIAHPVISGNVIGETGERPKLVHAFFCIDSKTGMVTMDLLEAIPCEVEFANMFLTSIGKFRKVPMEVRVDSDRSIFILGELCQALGIRLTKTEHLKMSERAIGSFREFMGGL